MLDERTMKKEAERAKRWNIVIFGIFAITLAVLIAAVCVFKYQHTWSPAKWFSDRENRYKIVSSMLNQNQLVGMAEADVVQLLGNEDSNGQTSFKMSKTYFPPETTLVYYLGVDFMDIKWLIISLNAEGVVTDYCIDVT